MQTVSVEVSLTDYMPHYVLLAVMQTTITGVGKQSLYSDTIAVK